MLSKETLMLKKVQKADAFFSKATAFFSSFLTPRKVFFILALFLLFHGFMSICFNNQLYRDVAGVYAWYAREFGNGVWHDIPLSKVPVLNVFLGGLLVRCGVEPYTSVIILSVLFMGLTLIPLYKLLKIFVPAEKAAWGCVLFTLVPKTLRFAGTGLLETTRDFFLVSALYFLFKSWNSRCRWYDWGLFGVSLGFLALARGEGIFMAGLLAVGILFRSASDWETLKRFANNILLPAFISGVFALAVMSPVAIQNCKVTGFPVTDARMIGVLQSVPGINKCFTLKTHAVKNDPRILTAEKYEKALPEDNEVLKRLRQLPENLFRGAYEPYFILAMLGIVLLLKKRQWRKEYSFSAGYCLLVALSFIGFSVSYRYFIFFIPLLMVFTLYALSALLNAAEKYHFKNILLTAVAVYCVLQPLNAWLWMIKDYDADELNIKKFVAQNRHRFLPPGEKRKLLIHGDPRFLFRTGEERLFHYGEPLPPAKYITGFDLMLVFKKNQKEWEDCKARRDLKQIEAPFKTIVVFAPVERKSE